MSNSERNVQDMIASLQRVIDDLKSGRVIVVSPTIAKKELVADQLREVADAVVKSMVEILSKQVREKIVELLNDVCECGHEKSIHRDGVGHCDFCGVDECKKFRPIPKARKK